MLIESFCNSLCATIPMAGEQYAKLILSIVGMVIMLVGIIFALKKKRK